MKIGWYIDDDEEMLQAIALLIGMLGYETQTFLSAGAATRALLDGERPAFILLDLLLPHFSGMDFLQQIRTEMEITSVPIIMVSAEFNDIQIHAALDAGADGYILKPVTLDQLDTIIKQAIDARKF